MKKVLFLVATLVFSSSAFAAGTDYVVQNQWGGPSAPWHQGGAWILSTRGDQNVVGMDISSGDGGTSLNGTMQYSGEGPIGFRGTHVVGNTYEVANQWGGSSAPWHPAGQMVIGGRDSQRVVKLTFTSGDNGETLTGTMTYDGEGPIGFKGDLQN